MSALGHVRSILLGLATLSALSGAACASGGGKTDFPFVDSGSSNTLGESDAMYLATFRYLIRTERWVGTDYVCVGIGTMIYDPQSPPGRMVSQLSSGTTRVVSATGCDIGRSVVQHRTTRNQAQLFVVTLVQRTVDGAEAEAFQFTSPVDQERFRCRLVEEGGQWKVERCESRRL